MVERRPYTAAASAMWTCIWGTASKLTTQNLITKILNNEPYIVFTHIVQFCMLLCMYPRNFKQIHSLDQKIFQF
jgi:hypothetical protein